MPGASAAGDVRAQKAALRTAVLARRDALAPDYRVEASESMLRTVLGLDTFVRARRVMAYMSFGSEIATDIFVKAVIASGKTLALPWIDRTRDALAVLEVRDPATELMTGRWGIREPDPRSCAELPPDELDFILVPGVAFDPVGRRLGHGKAYYDKLLGSCLQRGGTPAIVAAAFVVQVVDEVPVEAHDVRVPMIVTEAGTIGR